MTLKRFKDIIGLIFFILALMNIPMTTKVPYDKGMAKALIKDSYRPVIYFAESLETTEDSDRLKVPSKIRNQEDFVQSLHGKIDSHTAATMYEDWIIETENGLYADSGYYIPTIYSDERMIEEAYVRVRQPLGNKYLFKKHANIEKELIIKERSKEYNTTYNNRTYYYTPNNNGIWTFDHVNGTANIDFVDPESNPWYEGKS